MRNKVVTNWFTIITLIIVGTMYMFAFHNERDKHMELQKKYDTLEATCNTVSEKI